MSRYLIESRLFDSMSMINARIVLIIPDFQLSANRPAPRQMPFIYHWSGTSEAMILMLLMN